LQHIKDLIKPHYYNHIWDCCCDHGLLGLALLPVAACEEPNYADKPVIHFVDIVPELMNVVEEKLRSISADDNQALTDDAFWQCHCMDVAKLPLTAYPGRHLVIIAGVGGDLMIKFIEAIHQRHKDLPIDFILCPIYHQHALRAKLISLNFSLIDEVLVEENKQFYEILAVSSQNKSQDTSQNINGANAIEVPAVGEKILKPLLSKLDKNLDNNLNNDDVCEAADSALRYLNQNLNHYQRIKQGLEKSLQRQNMQQALPDNSKPLTEKQFYQFDEYVKIQAIISAYQAVLPSNTNR
jgi:tRNA (adenine22-N1)-methyltransferase